MSYPESFAGTFLVASPQLQDPNFRTSVVMIIHENEEGILGYILNRRTEKKLSDFWQPVFGKGCPAGSNVLFVGGPIPGPLAVIHQAIEYSDWQISDGYYVTMEKHLLGELVENNVTPAKFLLGQSGWTREQLIGELEVGMWYFLPEGSLSPYDDESDLWVRALQKSANLSLSHVTNIKIFPDDPSVN